MEARDGKPVSVRGTGDEDEPGVPLVDCPGRAGNDRMEEISREATLRKFDENEPAFLYQDKKAGGEQGTFFKLVSRETAEAKGRGQQRRRQKGRSMGSDDAT